MDRYSIFQDYILLIHSLLAITTPFALIPSGVPFELSHLIKSSRCTRLFVHAQFLREVLPIAKNAGIPPSKVYILEGTADGWKSFSELIDNVRTRNIVPVSVRPAAKETLAYLIFSSGTTGLPKGWTFILTLMFWKLIENYSAVMISHGNILYVLMQIAIMDRAVAEVSTVRLRFIYIIALHDHALPQPPPLKTEESIPVGLGFLPLHHTYGLQFYSFRPFLKPSTVILLSRWDIKIVLNMIQK